MEGKKLLKIGFFISISVFFVGLILFWSNKDFLGYCTFLWDDGGTELPMFSRALNSNMIKRGDNAVIGIFIMCFSLIVLLITHLISNSKVIATSNEAQVNVLSSIEATNRKDGNQNIANSNIANQIREMSILKDEGMITEEEYTAKKKQLLGL